jgi:hypothetical protein
MTKKYNLQARRYMKSIQRLLAKRNRMVPRKEFLSLDDLKSGKLKHSKVSMSDLKTVLAGSSILRKKEEVDILQIELERVKKHLKNDIEKLKTAEIPNGIKENQQLGVSMYIESWIQKFKNMLYSLE